MKLPCKVHGMCPIHIGVEMLVGCNIASGMVSE